MFNNRVVVAVVSIPVVFYNLSWLHFRCSLARPHIYIQRPSPSTCSHRISYSNLHCITWPFTNISPYPTYAKPCAVYPKSNIRHPISIILNFDLPNLLHHHIRSITSTLSKCLFLPSLPLTITLLVTLCWTPVKPAYWDDTDISFAEAFRCDVRDLEKYAWGDERC